MRKLASFCETSDSTTFLQTLSSCSQLGNFHVLASYSPPEPTLLTSISSTPTGHTKCTLDSFRALLRSHFRLYRRFHTALFKFKKEWLVQLGASVTYSARRSLPAAAPGAATPRPRGCGAPTPAWRPNRRVRACVPDPAAAAPLLCGQPLRTPFVRLTGTPTLLERAGPARCSRRRGATCVHVFVRRTVSVCVCVCDCVPVTCVSRRGHDVTAVARATHAVRDG